MTIKECSHTVRELGYFRLCFWCSSDGFCSSILISLSTWLRVSNKSFFIISTVEANESCFASSSVSDSFCLVTKSVRASFVSSLKLFVIEPHLEVDLGVLDDWKLYILSPEVSWGALIGVVGHEETQQCFVLYLAAVCAHQNQTSHWTWACQKKAQGREKFELRLPEGEVSFFCRTCAIKSSLVQSCSHHRSKLWIQVLWAAACLPRAPKLCHMEMVLSNWIFLCTCAIYNIYGESEKV